MGECLNNEMPDTNSQNITLYIAAFSFAATVIGVMIGSISSYYISKRQFQSTVIATKRQEWINSLRDTISEYLSVLVTLDKFYTMTDMHLRLKDEDKKELTITVEKATLLRAKINLLINPNEDDHKRLSSLIKDALVNLTERQITDLDNCITEITNLGQKILGDEWRKVKKGT